MATKGEEFNPYQILNVNPDATTEEIQESYKRLSRTFHPDRNSLNMDASREEFEAITKAKQILSDPQTRRAYDCFGLKGLEMMQRGDVYPELHALQIGKQYRNDDAVRQLLKYYLKRELSPPGCS